MCGILFRITNKPQAEIEKYFNLTQYRGPNNTSVHVEDSRRGKLYFCHHRLEIINPDSEEDNQPFVTPEYVLIANGEIYNYKLFQFPDRIPFSGDCRSIAELLLQDGSPRLLDGDFAFVYYHREHGKVIAARDTIGLKPLYIGYNTQNQIVGFASEPKSMQYDDEIARIAPLQPGTSVEVSLNTQTGCPLFIKFDTNNITLRLIRKYLTDAVRKRIKHSDVPVGLLCSGGIDSSIITAIASKLFPERQFQAYTIEYSGMGMKMDSFYAEQLVSALPAKNVHLNVFTFTKEEGMAAIETVIHLFETHDVNTIRAGIPMYLLAKHIAETSSIKVLLSGEGADELFLGYEYFTKGLPKGFKVSSRQAKEESLRLLNNLHEFDILRAERSFAGNGLELRVPFLDKDLIQFVNTIPGMMLLPQHGIEKALLRQAFEVSATSLGIPLKILERQKERLSDGIGHGWVPDLIRHCVQYGGEGKYFREIYNRYFPQDKVQFVARELPEWVSCNTSSDLIGMS